MTATRTQAGDTARREPEPGGAPAEAVSFAVPGATLTGEVAGAGQTVLFVHGSVSDSRTWDAVFRAVAARFRAVRYSRRFHHPNPAIAPGEVYSYEQHVDDLLAVIDAQDAELSLVGHSSGGVLALLAAVRRPEAVRRLVLVEPAVFGRVVGDPPRLAEIGRALRADPWLTLSLVRFALAAVEPARAAARRGDSAAAIRRLGRGVLGRRALARLSPERARQVEENFFAAELLGPGMPRIGAEEVQAVRCPTLVVAGDESPRHFRRLARLLAAELPNGELAVLPGASHIVHEDAPEAFAAALTAFLNRGEPT